MKFLAQFNPSSQLAYLAIGFMMIILIQKNLETWNFIYLGLISLGIISLCGYRRVFALILGISIGIISICNFSQEIIDSNLTESDYERIARTGEFKISYKKEVKRNFYETEILFENKTYSSITKRYKKSISLPNLHCDSDSLVLKKASKDQDYFRFLRPYDFNFTIIIENKCRILSETIDTKRLLRKNIEDILNRSRITDTANDIAMGLFFGDSSYLESEFKDRVREGGILHLFAASGLHIGVFIGFLFFIAKRIWFLNFYLERILPLFIAFSYLYILNFPVSLLRAYIFASILIIGSLLFRKMKSIDLVIVSSGIIYLIDKDNFLSLSYILSYSAVAGILFLKQFLDELFFGKWKNFFTENFTISVSASLGTYPVLVLYFKSFSFGSIFLNYLLVPLTSLLLPLLYVSLFAQLSYESFLNKVMVPISENLWSNSCPRELAFDWLDGIFKIITEILWTYSELLLRVLAFLSEIMSEKLGFYRSVENSFLFHLYLYLLIGIILCICIIYFEFRKNNLIESKKKKKHPIFISIFSILLIGFFFFFGYILYPEQMNDGRIAKKVFAGSDFYLVKEEKEIFLGGTCKYSHFQIQKHLNQTFCEKSIKSIYIESETCLSLAVLCQRKSKESRIYSAIKYKDWESTYSFLEFRENSLRRKFSNLLVFYPHIDSLFELQRNAKQEKGNILLLFAYKLKDSAKDWNENKKILGINANWNFITPDEL